MDALDVTYATNDADGRTDTDGYEAPACEEVAAAADVTLGSNAGPHEYNWNFYQWTSV